MSLLRPKYMSSESKKIKRVFISACEASADAHCAHLIESVKSIDASVEFIGIGGEKMAAAGCELLENTVSKAAMMYNAFGQISFYIKLIKRVRRLFRDGQIDKVVVCDSPAFNFHVAKAAKKSSIPTLFYVAPQLWAWAPWRIHKLKRCCDQLASILPFEKKWFAKRGLDCEFVGNPLFDELAQKPIENLKDFSDYQPEKAKIVLLPGSRDAEIEHLWVPMQQIASKLKNVYPDIEIIAVASDQEKLAKLKGLQIKCLEISYSNETVIETCQKADYCFVASGSATLQVAAAGCPMTIIYQANKWLWHLVGRWLINAKHLSLVNILAQRELVPEFMPYFTSTSPIYETSLAQIADRNILARIGKELIEETSPLAIGNTSDRVAKMLFDSK